ncbi:coenzyme F420-0:L-glutamate ligase [Dermabacteraceae bacterium TAE3-ERU27]|nr:coenzyme F420-0:L-glutamate ligase [Dermabacteraceae bacterium TAE3-ERU27]
MPDKASEANIQITVLSGVPEVVPGSDLAQLILQHCGSAGELDDGDIVCVASKIVSKSLGLQIPAAEKAAAEAAHFSRIVARRRGPSRITSVGVTVSGPVMAAAGIDTSNTGGQHLLTLPTDPDSEAEKLRQALSANTGKRLGVLITDTVSRPWRLGIADIALGASGVRTIDDARGSTDRDGRVLGITQRALADEVACAADLARSKANGAAVVIVRGLSAHVHGKPEGARQLNRTGEDDWFARASLESVWHALGCPDSDDVASLEEEEPEARRARALRKALHAEPAPVPRFVWQADRLIVYPAEKTSAALIAAARFCARAEAALRAENLPALTELKDA